MVRGGDFTDTRGVEGDVHAAGIVFGGVFEVLFLAELFDGRFDFLDFFDLIWSALLF